MIKVNITTGTRLEFFDGIFTCEDYNGHIVEGCMMTFPFPDEDENTELQTMYLTLSEIADELWRVSGRNHKVLWKWKDSYDD